MITGVPFDPAPNPRPLAEEFPDELQFFKRTFVWDGGKDGCYIRTAYETERIGDVVLTKWRPLKTRGNWQKLYPALADSLAEKHLDFDRFRRTCLPKDRLRSEDHECAFWLGTMAGPKTRTHCIDLDSHDYIGWRSVPTRWHQLYTGDIAAPHEYRYVPVIRPSLKLFMLAKRVYGQFPGRIWAFSSANLGLSVWKVFSEPELTPVIRRKAVASLKHAGIATVEHFPNPSQNRSSYGVCHRRPCGMDSAVVTSTGVITDPIEQVRWFMRPGKSPSFAEILDAYRSALKEMYDVFLADGSGTRHEYLPWEKRKELVAGCWKIFNTIEEWAQQGCPLDLVPTPEERPKSSSACSVIVSSPATNDLPDRSKSAKPKLPENESLLELFRNVDIPAVVGAGQWIRFVRFLVENGFPTEDKFYEIVSSLARWFGLVEWYGRPREDVKELLRQFVLTRHNGMISRLTTGQEQDVLDQVGRIVDRELDRVDDPVVFEDLRRRRATGKYQQNYEFAPLILHTIPLSTPSPLSSSFLCGSLTKDGESEEQTPWQYVPDISPLLDDEVKRLFAAFQRVKRPLRRRGDSYPVLDAITQFFNYLRAGRKQGRRRASKALLIQMGFPSNGSKRKKIFDVLIGAGFIRQGGYRSMEQSRLWELRQRKDGPECPVTREESLDDDHWSLAATQEQLEDEALRLKSETGRVRLHYG